MPLHSFVEPGAYLISPVAGTFRAFPIEESEDESDSFSVERDESSAFYTSCTQGLWSEDSVSAPCFPAYLAGPQSEVPVIDAIDILVVDDSTPFPLWPNKPKRGLRRVFRKLSKLLYPHQRRRSSFSSSEIKVASPLTTSSSNEMPVVSPVRTSSPNPWSTPSVDDEPVDDEPLSTFTYRQYGDKITMEVQEEEVSPPLQDRKKGDDNKADYKSTSGLITKQDNAADTKEVVIREHSGEHHVSQPGAYRVVCGDEEKDEKDQDDDQESDEGSQATGRLPSPDKHKDAQVDLVFQPETDDTPGLSSGFSIVHDTVAYDNSMTKPPEVISFDPPLLLHDSGFAEELVVASQSGYLGKKSPDEQQELYDFLCHAVQFRVQAIRKFKLQAYRQNAGWEARSTLPLLINTTSRDSSSEDEVLSHESKDADNRSQTSASPATTVDLETTERTDRKDSLLAAWKSLNADDKLEFLGQRMPELVCELMGEIKSQDMETLKYHGSIYSILWRTLTCLDKRKLDCNSLIYCDEAVPSMGVADQLDGTQEEPQQPLAQPQPQLQQKPSSTHVTLQVLVLEEHDGTMPLTVTLRGLIADRSFIDDDETQHGHFVPPNYLSESHEPALRLQVRSCIVDHMKQRKTILAGLVDDDDMVPDLEPLLESRLALPRYQRQGRENASTAPVHAKDASLSDLQCSMATLMPDDSLHSCLKTSCHRCRLYTTAVQSCQKPVDELKRGVVLVGLWDATRKGIVWVGSGFVADPHLGLVVTAAHILFNLEDQGQSFGSRFFGLTNAKVVLGVLKDDSSVAVYRYCGEVIDDGINDGVDACIVLITSQFRRDVDDEGPDCAFEPEVSLTEEPPRENEPLYALQLAKQCEKKSFKCEAQVRVIGYNQEGEGVFIPRTHLNRMVDYAGGEICGKFERDKFRNCANLTKDILKQMAFCPRDEIITTCRTMSGHSGGPCVNEEGLVIGILSRGTSTRSYIVPSWELLPLLERARSYIGPSAVYCSP